MKNTHHWNKLEKIADESTSSEQRRQLLKEIESCPELLAQWKAFRVLQAWPESYADPESLYSPDNIVLRVREENSVDSGIKRLFPYVATAALVASLILAFINIGQKDNASDITLDDVFGLPTPSIENAILVNL